MNKYEQLKQAIVRAKPDAYQGNVVFDGSEEIGLCDVLLAYTTRNIGYHPDILSVIAGQMWNLQDDNLDHQTDETKQFLIDLLCNKT